MSLVRVDIDEGFGGGGVVMVVMMEERGLTLRRGVGLVSGRIWKGLGLRFKPKP